MPTIPEYDQNPITPGGIAPANTNATTPLSFVDLLLDILHSSPLEGLGDLFCAVHQGIATVSSACARFRGGFVVRKTPRRLYMRVVVDYR